MLRAAAAVVGSVCEFVADAVAAQLSIRARTGNEALLRVSVASAQSRPSRSKMTLSGGLLRVFGCNAIETLSFKDEPRALGNCEPCHR